MEISTSLGIEDYPPSFKEKRPIKWVRWAWFGSARSLGLQVWASYCSVLLLFCLNLLLLCTTFAGSSLLLAGDKHRSGRPMLVSLLVDVGFRVSASLVGCYDLATFACPISAAIASYHSRHAWLPITVSLFCFLLFTARHKGFCVSAGLLWDAWECGSNLASSIIHRHWVPSFSLSLSRESTAGVKVSGFWGSRSQEIEWGR